MAVKLASLKANLPRENDGDWIQIPDLLGVRLLVRSFHYGPYKTALAQVQQRFRRKYGYDGAPDDVAAREAGKLYADHILLGWEGLDVPYSRETALEVLTDPAHRAMRGHVDYASAKVAETSAEFIEDASGN